MGEKTPCTKNSGNWISYTMTRTQLGRCVVEVAGGRGGFVAVLKVDIPQSFRTINI
jgi:hypothetical protein